MSKAIWSTVAAIVASFLITPPVFAQQAGDARFLAARDAIRAGDRGTLERLVREADGHPLDAYARYWLLFNKLARPEPPPQDELLDFIVKEAGTLLSERLRADWLRRLAKDKNWALFLQLYINLQIPDDELRCNQWTARLNRGEEKAVLDEIAQAWQALNNTHSACDPLLKAVIDQGLVSTDGIWLRFRRQADTRTPAAAKTTLSWLKAVPVNDYDQILKKPANWLNRVPAAYTNARAGQEFVLVALIRLARENVSTAHARLLQLGDRLTDEQRAYAWATLALRGAQDQRPEAPAWFRAAADQLTLTAEQRAWRVRASLRAEDWSGVLAAIDQLPPEERSLPTWSYWHARALAALGQAHNARIEFANIADPGFYGILAREELGRPLGPLPTTPVSLEADLDVEKNGGFQRALALFRLDMRIEGIREWNWALREQGETFRLAAARLALKNGLYDRAINSAELASPDGAFELRFLTPYRELIEPHARDKGLDMSWVYGIMRQESRFVVPARSTSGAQGLMQIMPATGKWLARKLGIRYHPDLLTDPTTNVHFGTEYMRIILGELGNHPVLASAGYNAGPGRARRWRDRRPLEGAIYTETIPFDETRDYVKKVMANTVIYAALLEGRPQSLKTRLGKIAPRPAEG
ncbi:transglycosylase [Betaproteobacteria bacterium]|nr:transglycosylase [Betaproteobacteria bacterium]GHU02496.1 transglycosylase [Betaproteobacteria bacterium]GHU22211.1 transglycosylase [Betaproteobacteria bacterium]